jgi:hypothetical protein
MDWHTTELPQQFEKYGVLDFETLDNEHQTHLDQESASVRILIELHNLDDYATCWGIQSGVWFVLAVLKMIHDILEDYATSIHPRCAAELPNKFKIAISPDDEQEITHRLLTAYHELYDMLVRVHSKTKTRIWNRHAAISYFPHLTLEHLDTHNEDVDYNNPENGIE